MYYVKSCILNGGNNTPKGMKTGSWGMKNLTLIVYGAQIHRQYIGRYTADLWYKISMEWGAIRKTF